MRCEANKVNKNVTNRDSRARQPGSGDKVKDEKSKTKKCEEGAAPIWSNEPSTSAAYEKTYTEEQAQQLFRQIFSNDLIMSQIIGNINNLTDRVNFERTTHHFYKLSRKCQWKFTKMRNELNMTYYALDTSIILEHGNLKFRRPSMTLVDRRELFDGRNQQTSRLLATVSGIASRFAKNIKTMRIGGTDPNARIYGIGDHQLIITADLLKILVTQFPNVEELYFRNCGFDRDSVEFLDSYEGSVFSKLKHLGLNSVWCDGDASPSMLMRLINRNLETLSLQYLKIEQNVGDAVLGALEREEPSLQNIDVTVANYFRVQPIEVQRYLRSLSRAANKITVRLMGSYDERAPALVGAFQTAVELENLTGIYVDHFPLGRYENFDYDLAVQGLENVNRLSALSLNGWQDKEILKSLITSLTGAFLLESFCLRNLSEMRNPEYSRDLDRLFAVLKVIHIDLSNIRDMNSNHLRTLCRKIPNLRSLRLAQVPRVSTHAVEQCLKKWPYLEVLEIQTPLTATGVEILCSKRYQPQLKRACFWMQADQQKRSSMEKLLRNFERVDCWTNGAPDRHCRVSVRDRRLVELVSVPPTTVTYCHADHNPHYHEPLPPRERWDSVPRTPTKPSGSKIHHDRNFKIH